MPAVAATNPPVLVAMVAAATERIRVGSGGVMLPNHAPLVVAEQFALLEAAHPGRIDLGIGRAPGTDPVTSYRPATWGRRGHRRRGRAVPVVRRRHPRDDVARGRGDAGARPAPPPQRHPACHHDANVWLLGSSDYSARLAAAKGLPYVFAHHFSGSGTAEALELYRSGYQPSERHPEPRTFLTVNAVVAETAEEARRLALPNILTMVALRTGAPLGPQPTIEDAEQRGVPEVHRPLAEQMTSALGARHPHRGRGPGHRARHDVRRRRGHAQPSRRRDPGRPRRPGALPRGDPAPPRRRPLTDRSGRSGRT